MIKKRLSYFISIICIIAMIMPCVEASAAVNRGKNKNATVGRSRIITSKEIDEKEDDLYVKVWTEVKETESTESVVIPGKTIVCPADIVFVIDSTGSMYPYIKNVAENIESFSKYLDSKGIESNMAVIEYRDITCDGKDSTIVYSYKEDKTDPWHKSTDELVTTLNTVKNHVGGGGDEPETVVDALGNLVDEKEPWPFHKNSCKFAILLTDATYKEDNNHGFTMDSLITALNKQEINVSVVTHPSFYSVYKNLVGAKGITADINSKDFHDVLKTIADQIVVVVEDKIEEIIKKDVVVTSGGEGTVQVGKSVKVKVTMPESFAKKDLKWAVEDGSIASISVSDDTMICTVKGLKVGKTKVTAKTDDNKFKGSYDIEVVDGTSSGTKPSTSSETPAIEILADDFIVSPNSKTIAKGKSFNINIKVPKRIADNASSEEELEEMIDNSIDSVTYRSTKSSIVSVSSKGVVKGKKTGTAVIKTTISTADGTTKTFQTKVYVK